MVDYVLSKREIRNDFYYDNMLTLRSPMCYRREKKEMIMYILIPLLLLPIIAWIDKAR
jgi:hypothetical protein